MSSEPLMGADSSSSSDTRAGPESTLSLGKHLSVSIGAEGLHIHDSHIPKSVSRSCCGIAGSANTVTIPLYNLLWVEVGDASVTIKFAAKASKSSVKASSLMYPYEIPARSAVEAWAAKLLSAAYGTSIQRPRYKVLINPFGGQGSAARLFETSCRPILEAANCTLDVQTTLRSGHAVDIAREIDVEAYDAILCCSGDGVPHEVFNGLAKRDDAMKALKTIAVGQLPGGSGNALCWNLTGTGDPSAATLSAIKSTRKSMDLVSISQGDQRFLSFLSQSFGIIADVDLGTEDLRWMGDARFTYGLIQRIWRQTVYPCDLAVKIAVDDKEVIREHYRQHEAQGVLEGENGLPALQFGTVNSELPDDWELIHQPNMGNFYAGNMSWVSAGVNFFPASLPNDGMFDLICVAGNISRRQALKMLVSVESGEHFDLPHVSYRKILGYRIIPHKRPGVAEEYISIDGERILFEPFQAEVIKGLGTVLARAEQYLAPGV